MFSSATYCLVLQAQGRAIDAKQGVVARWSSMKILLRSTLFKRLTLCIMISGGGVALPVTAQYPQGFVQ